jgi:hypothetical protein
MSDAKTPIGKVAAYVKEQIPAQVEKAVSEIELPIAKDGADGIGLNLKAWDEGIHREGTLVQHNMGQAFKALRDTSAEPGSSDDWERMGSAGFRWTGVKNFDFDYQDGDLYIDGGTTFIWFNGKGHMFSQRGKNGKDGIDGKDGTNGRDAAKVLEIRWDNKGIAFAYDNGDLIEVDVSGLEAMQKRLSWLEEQFLEEENIDAPIKAYLGSWKVGTSYALGDTVTSGKGFYLCIEADGNSDSLDPDKWIKLAGAASGGGVAPRPVIPYGSLWMRATSATTITTPATFVLVDVPAAAGNMSQFEKANQSRLVHTGSERCVFQLNFMLGGQATAVSIIDVTLFLNGTISEEFVVSSTSTANTNSFFSLSASIQIELGSQDYIEMYAQCSAGDLLVESYSITAHGLC